MTSPSTSLAARIVLPALALGMLAVGLATSVRSARAAPSELFISEYVEGSGNNKALEIFNGTGGAVVLAGAYDIQLFANGSATATATIPLAGLVADGDVFVLARNTADAAILAQTDQATANFLFNGDDAVALRKNGVIVDVIGQIGFDPGVEWGTGDASTADDTLRRRPQIEVGDANGADAFDPGNEWLGLPADAFDGLGSHTVSTGAPGNPPVAADDAAVFVEDGGAGTIEVLANDGDLDGDALTISGASAAANGSVVVAVGGGSLVYTPDVDFNGTDSFAYTVSDGNGGSDSATVSVTVEPVNDDPDVENDAVTTPEDASVAVTPLLNDEDVDGDTLTIAGTEEPEGGSTILSADGTSILYAPDPDVNGTDTFEYTVSDGHEGIETGEVVVTVAAVNDPPRPQRDSAITTQGASVVVDVLANDTPGPADEAGQALHVVSLSAPVSGTAELVATGPDLGRVRYTPNAGFKGSDSFDYLVSDGEATATGTVDVGVKPATMKTICGLAPTILGTTRDDVIQGTPGDDVIRARRGNDIVSGNGGNDVVCGGPGADQVATGAGDDRIAGGSGADIVQAGGGADHVRGGFGADSIEGEAGDDAVAAGPGADSVDAGGGRNTVAGGVGDDRLTSGPGDDRLDGGPGTDTCDADGGNNTVVRCE